MNFQLTKQQLENQLDQANMDLQNENLTYAEKNEIQKFIRETMQFLVFEIDTLEENYNHKQSQKE